MLASPPPWTPPAPCALSSLSVPVGGSTPLSQLESWKLQSGERFELWAPSGARQKTLLLRALGPARFRFGKAGHRIHLQGPPGPAVVGVCPAGARVLYSHPKAAVGPWGKNGEANLAAHPGSIPGAAAGRGGAGGAERDSHPELVGGGTGA